MAPYNKVKAFQIALSSSTGPITMHFSDNPLNYGGFTLFENRSDHNNHFEVKSYRTDQFMKEQGLSAIDLIKIDVEGAEYDILTSIDPGILSTVKIIVGELHGIKEQELLKHLKQWFDITRNQPELQITAINRG